MVVDEESRCFDHGTAGVHTTVVLQTCWYSRQNAVAGKSPAKRKRTF